MAFGLGTELIFLLRQCTVALLQFPTPPLIFGHRDDAVQVRIRQTIQLLAQTGAAFAQVLAAGLQFLRQPMPPVGALQGPGKFVGVAQHFAQVLPHQLIEPASRRKTRWAMRASQCFRLVFT